MSWDGVSEWAGKISWAKWQKPDTLRYQNFIEPMETILGSSNANKQTNKWKKERKERHHNNKTQLLSIGRKTRSQYHWSSVGYRDNKTDSTWLNSTLCAMDTNLDFVLNGMRN